MAKRAEETRKERLGDISMKRLLKYFQGAPAFLSEQLSSCYGEPQWAPQLRGDTAFHPSR